MTERAVATGTLTAAAQVVVLQVPGHGGAAIQVSGTWAGTVIVEGSVDGTNYNIPIQALTANRTFLTTIVGLQSIQCRMSVFTSGSAAVMMASISTAPGAGAPGSAGAVSGALSSFIVVSTWRTNHQPATNTKATITQAAPGAGLRNVVTGWTAMYAAQSSAPSATAVSVAVIDGPTGGTSFLDGPHALGMPAVAGATNGITRHALAIPGTPNTGTTIEFSAAGGANTLETVSMEGVVALA